MADRKPLVIVDGVIQELSSSDTIPISLLSGIPSLLTLPPDGKWILNVTEGVATWEPLNIGV
jgi:hypothetical protein